MKIEELIVLGNKDLHKDQVKLILSTILGINPLELILHLDEIVPLSLVNKYKKIISYIKLGKPIQYALNNACFYGYDYYVDERVLIPRFETEELVHEVINYLKYFNNPNGLDMCSGSGCIGLTLKMECPNITMTLADISIDALNVLKINQEKYAVDCQIVESDLFNCIHEKYDFIVCNPPYVSHQDSIMDVVKYEPEIALYSSHDGLLIYERFLKDCEKYLNDKYLIAFEIGAYQKDDIIKIIRKNLKDVSVITKKDANNFDRMIFIFKNIKFDE